MANVLQGGDGMMGGGAGGFLLEQLFHEMSVCTRWWMTAALGASVLVRCHIISLFQLFYSYRRLLTTFFYCSPLSLNLLYHIFFLQRYARLLEESSGRSTVHSAWLLTFTSILFLCIAPIYSMAFLGSTLSNTLIYIWNRGNADSILNFLELSVFKALYSPWVLLACSLIMRGTVPKDEMCGIVVGHIQNALLPHWAIREPRNTYNMDKKCFFIGITNRSKRVFFKVVWASGEIKAAMQDGNREWVTLLAGACASEATLPPAFIYQGTAGLQPSWIDPAEIGKYQTPSPAQPRIGITMISG
ncbi:derlin-1.1 [Alternaria alternata]|nr:derlin-1.1 [Alternaria alternata]